MEYMGKPLHKALLQVLAERRLILESDSQCGGPPDGQEEGSWNLPDDFLMVYVCKWDPHERPDILLGLVS